jgi:UDP-N-acetylmuramoyl-tripeptide--D-alanyl-D-alanine ligase
MFNLFTTLFILWAIWEVKYVLFWLYLWQLKDYHIGRFIDHFRTYKGSRIFLNAEQGAKIILLLLIFLSTNSFNILFLLSLFLYIFEGVIVVRSLIKKSFKIPQKTVKILLLAVFCFTIIAGFLILNSKFFDKNEVILLLLFDLLTPVIVSAIVLLIQPFFVLLRNNILRKAFIRLNNIRAINNFTVIAITGSYGKTSTKEFLATILSTKFCVLSTKEHQNSEIGIAKCILDNLRLQSKKYPEIFIAEVGAYDKGKVKQVCNMLKPKIGVVTGVNEQHLALFGSMENLLSAEGGIEMAEILEKENGKLFVNGNNKFCLELYKNFNGIKKIYCEDNKKINADIWADSPTITKENLSFIGLNKNGDMAHFQANVLGKQNIQNLLGAICIARDLGMTFGEIANACLKIKPKQAGMTVKSEKHGINIIDSSYSSNPDGVYADLDYLSLFEGKKIVVMPCLIELGNKSSEIHYNIGKKIGKICSLAIITSKDKFIEIKKGCQEVSKDIKCVLCENAQDIYTLITLSSKTGDAVLLEGRIPGKLNELF